MVLWNVDCSAHPSERLWDLVAHQTISGSVDWEYRSPQIEYLNTMPPTRGPMLALRPSFQDFETIVMNKIHCATSVIAPLAHVALIYGSSI